MGIFIKIFLVFDLSTFQCVIVQFTLLATLLTNRTAPQPYSRHCWSTLSCNGQTKNEEKTHRRPVARTKLLTVRSVGCRADDIPIKLSRCRPIKCGYPP